MRYDKVHLYKADDGWRWRYVASNGRILADGAQGYSRRRDALRGARRVTLGTGRPLFLFWQVDERS